MRYIQFFTCSTGFQMISLFFCLVASISFTSGYKSTAPASSISRFLVPNGQLLRRQISSLNDENNNPLIAANHPDLPSESGAEENPNAQSPELQPQKQPAAEPIPNPQPGPDPNPLPKPQPIQIDDSLPFVNVPATVEPPGPNSGNFPPEPAPAAVPIVPLPIAPVPIVPVPLPPPAAATSSAPEKPRRPKLVPQPVQGFQQNPEITRERPQTPKPKGSPIILTGPAQSDYPDENQILKDALLIPPDGTVMYTEIGGLYPVRKFAEQANPQKFLYMDVFPYGYTWSNGRSAKWYQRFIDDVCRVFARITRGRVYLVSKYPYGPEFDCSVWKRIEYPALQENELVTEIILVDHTNLDRQRLLWTPQDGEIESDFEPRHKRRTTTAPCPDADSMQEGYPDVPLGTNVDPTPILENAAGWARVDIIQHQRTYPDVKSKLDVWILDAKSEQIGALDGAIAVPGQEVVVQSQLPFPVRIIVSDSDFDPLEFRYGELSWNSDDLSRCLLDPWKSGVREGSCDFEY